MLRIAQIRTAHRLLLGTALSLALAGPALATTATAPAPPVVYGQPHAEAVLTEALARQLPAGRIRMELDSRVTEVRAPAGAGTLAVENVRYNPVNGRFVAELVVADTQPTIRQPVSGRAFGVVEIPVLTRRVGTGETIGAGDLAWIEVRSDQAGSGIATAANELVGLVPKRGVPLNQPVRLSDVQQPRIIDKGAVVTIALQTATIAVTAQGRALQDGGRGEVIRVVNTQSNRVVEATVAGPNLVAVAKPGTMIR